MAVYTCALASWSIASTWIIIHLAATVGCICILATGTAGEDVSFASESLRAPPQTSAVEREYTASALTSATSVPALDIMTDTLSFNNQGDFVELYGFTEADSPSSSSSKVGWSFEFYVKTDSQTGLLLYATPMSKVLEESATLNNYDTKRLESEFIAIEIIQGKPALLIDDGEGILNVHSDIRISDGLWHHINAVFSPSHLELTVDRNSRTVKKADPALSDRLSSSTQHTLSHLNLTSIYLGGIDSIVEPVILQQQINAILAVGVEESSLVGCIREVKINRRVLEQKQIKSTSRFTQGPTCNWQFVCEIESPCIEDAQCFQSGFDSYICSCAEAECVRSDYVRSSSSSSLSPSSGAAAAAGGGATSVSKSRSKETGHHSTSQVDANEPVRGSSMSSTYVHSTLPGAGGGKSNLPGSSPRRKDDTTQDATGVGGKKVLQVSDLAAGQSHVDAHRVLSATSTGTSNAWGSGQRSGNLQPGHSSSFPSASVAPSSSSSSSSASAPSSSSSSSFSESPGANGNSPHLAHLTPTSHNTLDSMHINHVNSVGGFASDAFNLVISKEQFLIVTVIVALAIVILLFSLVIRAFYLLGRKSKSRPSLKSDAPRNSSSSSSSCSSPAGLIKENDTSCILPLTSTTTGSTSVAGSSSGGTSSSPLPFGSDCGFDHLTHLDSAINHSNFNGVAANQGSLSLSMACAASANGFTSSGGYGHIQHQHQQQQQQQQASHVNSHCQPHLTGSHFSSMPGEQSDEMMHGHNLAMMMSRCSSSGSMASSPLPPPPDPVSTRSHLLTYAPVSNLFYKKQSDHIQLHAYPGSHQSHLFQQQQQQQHRQQRDCDTLAGSSHLQQVDSSESSHLLMPAAAAAVAAGVTGSTSNGNVTGNTININSYTGSGGGNSENGCSDHLSHVTANSLTDAQVSLNYPESHEKRQLARYSTYGTVSSNKSPTGGIHSSNYTTDDIMDAYATYSRVDKKRDKNSCSTNESQKLSNHLQTTPNHHQHSHHQHRLSISSPSPSSASSASPYTPTTTSSIGETIAINTNNGARDGTLFYPLPPPSLFFSRQQRPSNSNNPSSPLLNSHDLTTTFKW